MLKTFAFLFIASFLLLAAPVTFVSAQGTNIGTQNGGGGTNIGTQGGDTQTTSGGDVVKLTNPLSAPDLPTFLNQILGFLIKIGGIVITFMVVYVGFKFVMAQGEPGALQEARRMLMWTLIGAAVLLGAQAISMAIQQTVQAIS